MIYLQLTYNLSLLIALSVLTGFIGQREKITKIQKSIIFGIIFGLVAIIGMLYPVNFAPGLIFDGRSVVISLCALFFGPVAVAISASIAIFLRLSQGGVGVLPGILVILESAVFGLIFHYFIFKKRNVVYVHHLLLMGIFIHVSMVLLMFTLPDNIAWKVVQTIGLPVIMIYPVATILIGKIISDNLDKVEFISRLKESEEKYRVLVENSQDIIYTLDLQGTFTFISPAWTILLGHPVDHIVEKSYQNLINPDDLSICNEFFKNMFNSTPEKNVINYRVRHTDGSWRWHSTKAVTLRDNAGSITGFLGIARDITDQMQAENDLNERIVQFHNLANSSSALIWTAGTDKSCYYFNDTWLKFTGRTTEQEKGNGWAEGVHPDDFDRCLKTYVTAFDKREKFEMEYRLRNAKGEYRWLLDIGTPNYDAKGEFIGYIGHCFDIDDRIMAEVEQKKKNEELRQMNSLMVDREIKMTELKEEINGLLKELGKKPKY
jgi:PAS domain S-box-containing protein